MKVAFHTLGCKVNQYETEALREQFLAAGYTPVPEEEFADVYIINTCTVTALADRKSRQFIRRSRKINPHAVVAVTGCYAQIKPEEVAALEGVEIVAGTDEKSQLLNMVNAYMAESRQGASDQEPFGGEHRQGERSDYRQLQENHSPRMAVKSYGELDEYEDLGVISGMESRSRAFVKIQEGCDRFCTYCIIPYARGKVRSRSQEEIIREVSGLVQRGYKEVVLTGINTALYGLDRGGLALHSLLEELDRIPGAFRIRLSSLEPTVIDGEYVKRLLPYEKLCHHLHLSIQSGSDHVLAAMNRKYNRSQYLEIVRVLREFDPQYGITTDIITGFPGETEGDFQDSLRMVTEAGFSRVHAFRYSPREGTPAAAMKDQVPGDVKADRSHRLSQEADLQAGRFYEDSLGQVRMVLFEREEDGLAEGYTDNYIKVYVPAEALSFQEFYAVKLLEQYKDGMRGEVLR